MKSSDLDRAKDKTAEAFGIGRQAVQKPSEAALQASVDRCAGMSMKAVQRRIGRFLGYTIFK